MRQLDAPRVYALPYRQPTLHEAYHFTQGHDPAWYRAPPHGRRASRGGGAPARSRRTRGVRRRRPRGGRMARAERRGRGRRAGGRRCRRRGPRGRRLPGHRRRQGRPGATHPHPRRAGGARWPPRDRAHRRSRVRRRRAVAWPPDLARRARRAARRRSGRGRAGQGPHAVRTQSRPLGARGMTAILIALAAVLVVVACLAGASVRVLREHERAVIFRLRRLIGRRGPGMIFLIQFVDRMVRVSLRTVTLSIPPQDVITRDNVPARVNAVGYFRVVDPNASVVSVEDAVRATLQISQTTLRSVLGKADLDTLLSEREHLNDALQKIIDEQTEPWGIKVTAVEIKDVGIPAAMQRAMARQAEAERERRAKIINAEGEFQAAGKLAEAAAVISREPAALQLRYMQTLREIGGGDQGSTIVFPLPIDLIKPLLEHAKTAAPAVSASEPEPANGELPEGARVNQLAQPQ